jgi:predicted ATPase
MIEQLAFKNFKGFKELKNLKIKPVTILCGTNSCGKSTILQNILLLKQTMESKTPEQNLLLSGRFVNLGNFENIIFEKKIEEDIVFEYTFNIKREEPIDTKNGRFIPPLRSLLKDLISEKSYIHHQAEYIINYKLTFGTKASPKHYINPIVIKGLEFTIKTKTGDNQIIPESSRKINLQKEELYDIFWEDVPFKHRKDIKNVRYLRGDTTKKIIFENLCPVSFLGEEKLNSNSLPQIDVLMSFNKIKNLLQYIFSSYTYMGPLRVEPLRRYAYENETLEIGNKGENAAYIYSVEKDNIIKNHYFYDSNSDSFTKKTSLKLATALAKWFDVMDIKNFKSEVRKDVIYLTLNTGSSQKVRVNIADVGFGVSQIFPIILEGLRMPSGNTLLLEQPEIHLHPKLQMQMADYFIALALSGKKVIAETHSDHVINRLVRRIVEDNTYNLKDLIAIYFISQKENGAVCEEICIDDKQGIVNWPVDFFDQTANEQEKIIQAGIKKRKIARQSGERI